jgi:Na+/phosphate symporter
MDTTIEERIESMRNSFDEKIRKMEEVQLDIDRNRRAIDDFQQQMDNIGLIEEKQLRLAEIKHEKGNMLIHVCQL